MYRMRVLAMIVLVAALAVFDSDLGAQAAAVAPAQTATPRTTDPAGRARLENEIRRGIARALRQRVRLNDDQMRRLEPIAQRYEQQRRQLLVDERDARVTLRSALRNEQTADQAQVDRLLQRLVGVQKRRLELVESEQRELATLMTPVQRAKYMAVQEQIRRRLEQMRQRRNQLTDGDAGDAGGSPRRPGRRPTP